MRTINHYSHTPFLRKHLMEMLVKDSFAGRLRKTIGDELDYRLVGKFEDDEEYGDYNDNDYSRWFPVEGLFLWIQKTGGLDPSELSNEDGTFADDNNYQELSNNTPLFVSNNGNAGYFHNYITLSGF